MLEKNVLFCYFWDLCCDGEKIQRSVFTPAVVEFSRFSEAYHLSCRSIRARTQQVSYRTSPVAGTDVETSVSQHCAAWLTVLSTAQRLTAEWVRGRFLPVPPDLLKLDWRTQTHTSTSQGCYTPCFDQINVVNLCREITAAAELIKLY